ncbi:MAG: PD40 domain-containing protein [Actinobacteria bacterium]|nr:PD40 domain-containing protein [Actinomycetota bacterium]
MWNTTGVPLRLVVLVAGVVLLFSQLGSIRFWRYLDDATTPGQEHAGLTRQEAVSGAVARVEGYLRHHRLPGGRILLVRAEPIDGRVQWWCKGCVHWQVELAMGDERFCIALTEDFAAFSNGCARWHPHAAPPPAALVAAARPVRVQTPYGSGGLLLQRRIGRTADLYVLDVTTGRLRRLTRTSRHEFSPVWSPDRRRIAFAVNLGGSELDVYTMRADGSEVARVTSSAGPDEEPTWLPDGRLAYSSVRDGIGSIYADDERVLEQSSSAEWSPSGKAIAFSAAHEFGFDIWLTDAEAKKRWKLTSTLYEDAYNPRWSPDGTRIAFATAEAIYVMRADGSGRRRLVSQPHDLALSWSPDGTRVAWVGNTERNFGIHATDVSSERTVRLTRHEGDHAPDWR